MIQPFFMRSALAQALFERHCERAGARLTGESHHPSGTPIDTMPASYRDDYLKDADAVLKTIALCQSPLSAAAELLGEKDGNEIVRLVNENRQLTRENRKLREDLGRETRPTQTFDTRELISAITNVVCVRGLTLARVQEIMEFASGTSIWHHELAEGQTYDDVCAHVRETFPALPTREMMTANPDGAVAVALQRYGTQITLKKGTMGV